MFIFLLFLQFPQCISDEKFACCQQIFNQNISTKIASFK